ncbi:MAG: PIN domain-containing protein, partial [Candidatus Sericytochromatia bacterium]|nr:PIN domain-containing protein [Candidatus Sericytochromatia bacterium]
DQELKITLILSGFWGAVYYFIENHPEYHPKIRPVFEAATRQELQLCTSVISLLEVLVLPYRHQRHDLVKAYTDILEHNTDLVLLPIDAETAAIAARLRARYTLRTPDALQLAAALFAKADVFLTHDLRLKQVTEIPVKMLSEEML